jgi:hypothetical protein
VQARLDRAAGVADRQRPDGGAAPHLQAGGDGGLDRLVGGPQPVGVVDAHHRAAGDHAGEDDRPVAGGQHRTVRYTLQVDAAVPGRVRVGQPLEGTRDRQRTVQGRRPEEAGRHGGRGRQSRGGGGWQQE